MRMEAWSAESPWTCWKLELVIISLVDAVAIFFAKNGGESLQETTKQLHTGGNEI
jgi:hypothetical protein